VVGCAWLSPARPSSPFVAPTAVAETAPATLNNRGQIVGRYSQTHADIQHPDSIHRGFLLDRGRYTTFDAPGGVVTWASVTWRGRDLVGLRSARPSAAIEADLRPRGVVWR
jgi:hypothetical protein